VCVCVAYKSPGAGRSGGKEVNRGRYECSRYILYTSPHFSFPLQHQLKASVPPPPPLLPAAHAYGRTPGGVSSGFPLFPPSSSFLFFLLFLSSSSASTPLPLNPLVPCEYLVDCNVDCIHGYLFFFLLGIPWPRKKRKEMLASPVQKWLTSNFVASHSLAAFGG